MNSNGFEQLLITGSNTGTLLEQTIPKQELYEQPNGQFQITENGALNLMKTESMDMLVVNNLAQDLSVGREQTASMQKQDLVESTYLTEPLDAMYQAEEQQQSQQQSQPVVDGVSNCLSSDGNSVGIAEGLPTSFLSSLVQTNTNNMPYIDNLCTAVFTVPEVEVLTSNESNLGELPEKLIIPSASESCQEQSTACYLMEVCFFQNILNIVWYNVFFQNILNIVWYNM